MLNAPKRYDVGKWRELMGDLKFEDPSLFEFIMKVVESGSRIFHTGKKPSEKGRNPKSGLREQVKLTEFILKNFEKGCLLGPFTKADIQRICPELHTSPLYCVPKKDTGAIRPIVNMSYPKKGISINTEIDPEWRTVKYVTVERLIEVVLSVGKGGYLWCADAKDAYLQVGVDERDWKWQGMFWMDRFFIITTLFFGLSSAPKIYTLFADAILWLILHENPNIFMDKKHVERVVEHYLDDFFGGDGSKERATLQFEAVMRTFAKLGVPMKRAKCNPPAQIQTILGFEFDTVEGVVRIPRGKIDSILPKIRDWLARGRKDKGPTKREILSLTGSLRWFAQVFREGSAFVRGLEGLAHTRKRLGHTVRLNRLAKRDLLWWARVLEGKQAGLDLKFLGKFRKRMVGDIVVWTDASGEIGVGGLCTGGAWFQIRWEIARKMGIKLGKDIFWMEMAGLAIACRLWGEKWRHQRIILRCDNESAVAALASRRVTFERPDVMSLIRYICGLAIRFEFYFWVEHIEGEKKM